MKQIIIMAMAAAALTLTGCAAVCNPVGIGISAGNGFNKGSLGIPGLALAGAEIGACGAYKLISAAIDSNNEVKPAKTGTGQETKSED